MGKSTLIIVLGYIMIFGMIQGDMYKITERAVENVSEIYENTQLRQLTNSALEYMISLHVQNRTTDTTVAIANWLGGSFSGSISLSGSDASTNTDTIVVSATGQFGGLTYTASANFQSVSAITLQMPTITSSMGFYAPNASITMRAYSEISGNDMNMDGTPGPGPDLPGITTTGTLSLTTQATSTISGAPPSPEPATAEGSWEDLRDLADSYEQFAHYKYTGDQVISGATYGSAEDPKIVYFDADCKFTASTVGYGILVVRGDLFVTAHFRWYGLVIVSGVSSSEVDDNADSNIYGALLVGAPTSTGTITSHSTVQYSTEAINMVMDKLITTGGGGTTTGPRRITAIQWWE
ncbi:MAG TPA: hypothetical protein DHW42_04815 [Candidatus Marinimicrobia bacterium]|nr:hypothetical protein [Candidatus Neomarinimicrobiota bacterium]